MIFVGVIFLISVLRREWQNAGYKTWFAILLALAVLLIGVGLGISLMGGEEVAMTAGEVISPAIPGQDVTTQASSDSLPGFSLLPVAGGVLALIGALALLVLGYGAQALRENRAFSLMLLHFTLILPMLSPIGVNMLGWNVPDTPGEIYNLALADMQHFFLFIIPLAVIAIGVGLWWNSRQWLINAAVFYAIFTVLYTTLFTNNGGFFSGLIGSLAYWIAQHDVQRGSQPWYYYLLIQVPIYELLPFLGSLLAVGLMIWRSHFQRFWAAFTGGAEVESELTDEERQARAIETPQSAATVLLLFWSLTSLAVYSFAGEKMPWLTVHITLPMILLAGWALGRIVEAQDWRGLAARRGWRTGLALSMLVLGLLMAIGTLAGGNPPFQGSTLEQLRTSASFITYLITAGIGRYLLYRWRADWQLPELFRMATLGLAGMLFVLTARTAIQATYVNYDQGNEYLVYAHGARGVKDVVDEAMRISQRVAGDNSLAVAYDDDTSWPLSWYMRMFPNQRFYGATPGRDLRDVPLIIVGDNNFSKIEPVVGDAYHRFDYIRMVWPNQDYFNLTWERVAGALSNPQMRGALWEIWLNRDHTAYGQVIGQQITLDNWNPADRMRLYVRKDIAGLLWEYGTGPVAAAPVEADPYDGRQIVLAAVQTVGISGSQPGELNRPRDIAIAPDGSLVVADTDNHRIQVFNPNGTLQAAWGTFSESANGVEAPGGSFSQPWGVAVAPDGTIYVADTWNHRVQYFSLDGQFLGQWGYFGQGEMPEAFWGPRDVAVDSAGRVYVTDTGNKRVVVFSPTGEYINQFGGFGLTSGLFDEPVGLAIDAEDRVYVADTWNQRVQVFAEQAGVYQLVGEWPVSGWYGQSLDNKPFLATGPEGQVFVGDPEGYRIIQFDQAGNFVRVWGSYGVGPDGIGLAGGLAVDSRGDLWLADTGNSRLLRYAVP